MSMKAMQRDENGWMDEGTVVPKGDISLAMYPRFKWPYQFTESAGSQNFSVYQYITFASDSNRLAVN